jgi:hypothetical protein
MPPCLNRELTGTCYCGDCVAERTAMPSPKATAAFARITAEELARALSCDHPDATRLYFDDRAYCGCCGAIRLHPNGSFLPPKYLRTIKEDVDAILVGSPRSETSSGGLS